MPFLSTASLFQPRSQQRMLLACALVSVVLHAALLALFPGSRDKKGSLQFLTATLARPAAVPALAEPKFARDGPQRLKRRRDGAHPLAAAAPPAAPQAAAPVATPAPEARAADALPAAMPSFGGMDSGGAPMTASAPAAPAAARPAVLSEAGNVDQYRLALMGAAKRYKRYPSQAVENGWTGKVEVRLVVARDGGVGSVLVKNSSGYGILDDQALDMIRKAEGVTPIPPALQGRQFSVDIPVVFDLQTG